MSTRAEFEAAYGREAAQARRCVVCGSRDHWTAHWMGTTEVYVCPTCAGDVLPRLQADAIARTPLVLADVELALEHQRAEFWRAIALRLLRARDARPA